MEEHSQMVGWPHLLNGHEFENNLRYADDTTLMAESKEELKSLLVKVNEESGKSWLKTHHSEH